MMGAIMIGISEALWASAYSVETWDIALFSVLVVVLTLRPGGLLGRHA
jgi:branched-subunit amino acid ABC-type transport system permease component